MRAVKSPGKNSTASSHSEFTFPEAAAEQPPLEGSGDAGGVTGCSEEDEVGLGVKAGLASGKETTEVAGIPASLALGDGSGREAWGSPGIFIINASTVPR